MQFLKLAWWREAVRGIMAFLCNLKTKQKVVVKQEEEKPTPNPEPEVEKEEDLVRFEDAHEPLIDKHTFKLAQEIMAERTHSNYRGSHKGPTIFSGKLFCADCGTRLTSGPSAITQRYICRKYHAFNKGINHARH